MGHWTKQDEEQLKTDVITACQHINNGGLDGPTVFNEKCRNCEVIYRLLRAERQKHKELEGTIEVLRTRPHDGPTDTRPEGQDASHRSLHQQEQT